MNIFEIFYQLTFDKILTKMGRINEFVTKNALKLCLHQRYKLQLRFFLDKTVQQIHLIQSTLRRGFEVTPTTNYQMAKMDLQRSKVKKETKNCL